MPSGYGVWEKTYYHRAMQTKIGQTLRAQYDLAQQPLPHRLFTILMQFDDSESTDPEASEREKESGSSQTVKGANSARNQEQRQG
jgi:hypothetical protein